MGCFILSITEYEDLVKGEVERKGKEVYEENNILFLKDEDWVDKFFRKLLRLGN